MRLLGMSPPETMSDLVAGWLAQTPRPPRARDDEMWAGEALYDLLSRRPDLLLEFIHAVLAAGPDDFQEANLAAGPLEDLLIRHGPAFIAEIELTARREPRFRRLLAATFRAGMPSDLWRRVRVAANLPPED